MKILGINGSPHKDGNTYKLINEIFKGARENGHTTEIVHLIDLNLQYCTWCFRCAENGVCQTSDVFMDHLNKILGRYINCRYACFYTLGYRLYEKLVRPLLQ